MILFHRWSLSLSSRVVVLAQNFSGAVNFRQFSVDSVKVCNFTAVPLNERTLVKLKGVDTLNLLQGLITNDVQHFENREAIYSLFLNTQGRVLWDTLLFKLGGGGEENQQEIVVECDKQAKAGLIRHLKLYRLRKKVEIEEDPGLEPWVLFESGQGQENKVLEGECCEGQKQEGVKSFPVKEIDKSIKYFVDPRVNRLGWRLLVPAGQKVEIELGKDIGYKRLRYSLGVAEGVNELPSGNCFPLESNGDYMHGISFHKGCYIGQELTARTHHTGVVRKRIMPIRLLEEECKNLEKVDPGTLQLTGGTSKSLGKIRGISGGFGIGLIRIEQALVAQQLKIGEVVVKVDKPSWWPKEAPKERQITTKP